MTTVYNNNYDSDETVLPDDIDNIDHTPELFSDVDYTYTELFSEPDCSMQHLTDTPPLHTIHSSIPHLSPTCSHDFHTPPLQRRTDHNITPPLPRQKLKQTTTNKCKRRL